WEEDAGYTPFSLAAEIAALLVAADVADMSGAEDIAAFLRDTADDWNERIEGWLYATGTKLARQCGVDGHYLRIVPCVSGEASAQQDASVALRNRRAGEDA